MNSTISSYYPQVASMYTAGVVQIAFLCISLVGNCLLFISLIYQKKLRYISYYFFISLAVCDILYVFFVLMPLVGNYFSRKNMMGEKFCEAHNYMRTMADGVAMWHVGFVLLNQYVFLSNYDFFTKYSTDKATLMQLVFSWFLPLLVMISGMIGNLGNSIYFSKVVHCMFLSSTSATLLAFHSLLSILLPGMFALTSGAIIYYNVYKIHKQVYAGDQVDPQDFRIDKSHQSKIFVAICLRIIFVSILQTIIREAVSSQADLLLFLDLTVSCLLCTNPLMYLLDYDYRISFINIIKCRKKGSIEQEDCDSNVSDSQVDLKGSEVALSCRTRAYSTAGIY